MGLHRYYSIIGGKGEAGMTCIYVPGLGACGAGAVGGVAVCRAFGCTCKSVCLLVDVWDEKNYKK